MDDRTKALVAHATIIGWIIALLMNSNDRGERTSFYLRQTIGLYIGFAVVSWIPVVNFIGWLILFAFWLLSLVYALQGETKIIPFGEYFQQWFRAL